MFLKKLPISYSDIQKGDVQMGDKLRKKEPVPLKQVELERHKAAFMENGGEIKMCASFGAGVRVICPAQAAQIQVL
ncbi:MAG: hypothetical protein HRU20_23540 [Pseudomonadales bacterium]|nr:hypothetical protein [Pseudomonadales bacterium]